MEKRVLSTLHEGSQSLSSVTDMCDPGKNGSVFGFGHGVPPPPLCRSLLRGTFESSP